MANDFTLHIDLQNIPSDTSRAKEKLNNVTNVNSGSSAAEKSDNTGIIKAAKTVGLISLGKQVVSSATNYTTYKLSTYGSRYGDSARQNEINNMMTITSAGLSFVTSTAGGAIAGATLGPIGAAVGAAIGAVSSVVGRVVDIIKNNEEYNRKRDIERISENRSFERLGLLASDRNRR